MRNQGISDICLYFLRPNNEKMITAANINTEISFSWLDCSGGKLLEGFENLLAKVMIPAVKAQEVSTDIPSKVSYIHRIR